MPLPNTDSMREWVTTPRESPLPGKLKALAPSAAYTRAIGAWHGSRVGNGAD